MTGEWCIFDESDLLDRFTRNELSFVVKVHGCDPIANKLAEKPYRYLSSYAPGLIALASKRVQYLKEIDRRQPISMVPQDIQPLIQTVSGALSDSSPPSVRTVCRDYRKWISTGRDIRAILFRYSDRGKRGARMLPEVQAISDQVVDELYMIAERKRVPEVHLEIVRRLEEANEFRYGNDKLPVPSQRTVYREIARRSPYDVMVRVLASAAPRWHSGYPASDRVRLAHSNAL